MAGVSGIGTDDYLNADSSFIDYVRFEDADAERRIDAQEQFIKGKLHSPSYTYPRLDTLYEFDTNGHSITDKKNAAYTAARTLRARKTNSEIARDINELYAGFHESSFKKIQLVEAARKLQLIDDASASKSIRDEFMDLNIELYGEMDEQAFSAIMHTEHQRLMSFEPGNESAQKIKSYLMGYFEKHTFSGKEVCWISEDEMARYRKVIDDRYAHVFSEIPDTPDSMYYDAKQCAKILRNCMKASGLAAAGWTCRVNPSKANPATAADTKTIYLPVTTRRNASELKRLYLHEGEVHARRAYLGEKTGIAPLEKGTAHYADVEEGLGVILECIVSGDFACSPSYERARDRYIMAGLGLGTDGDKKDARASFEIMWRLLAMRSANNGVIEADGISAAKKQAMQHADNAYRGTNFAMPGVMYTKLKVYYEGLMKNIAYLREHKSDVGKALDDALIGKHDHTDPSEHELVLRLTTQNTQIIR